MKTYRLTFHLRVRTTKKDSILVLADALAGDLVKAARELHKVEASAGQIKVNGKRLRIRRAT